MTRTYSDAAHAHATIMQAIRKPIAEILNPFAKPDPRSEAALKGWQTRRATQRANDPILRELAARG